MDKSALAKDMVDYVEVTNKALGVALTIGKQADVEKKSAAERIPALVDHLISEGLLTEAERKVASTQLSSHADTLEVTDNILAEMSERLKKANAKLAALNNGRPVDDDGSPSGIAKKADAEEDADMALLRLNPALAARYANAHAH